MAYDSQFVICVLHNGHPVREINGTASVPFNSEYKLRLKNKHSYLRAKARVWVDGRKASNLGDFILNAGETLDLERFLDSDLSRGNRFKFVPLSDRRVNDPTDPSNGVIKVEFYREHDYVKDITITDPTWKPIGPRGPRNPEDTNAGPYWQFTDCNSSTFPSGGRGSSVGTTSFTCVNASLNFVSNINVDPNAGATVEGGFSGQSFVYGDDFQTDLFPVTLTLRVKGIDLSKDGYAPSTSIAIGTKPKTYKKKRFCANCGRRRSRMADKFCPRCGNSY